MMLSRTRRDMEIVRTVEGHLLLRIRFKGSSNDAAFLEEGLYDSERGVMGIAYVEVPSWDLFSFLELAWKSRSA